MANLFNDSRLAFASPAQRTLRVGGPLKQAIKAERYGNRLVLEHGIEGVGGELYLPPQRPGLQAPRFSIEQDGGVVHAGKFEYG